MPYVLPRQLWYSMTFGFRRVEVLSAQFNGATLLVLALLIVYEAVRRLISPPQVDGTELEGLLPTVGYVPISAGIERIADMLVEKLKS